MNDLNISYEEQEGRRRRHWWNKIIGVTIVGPVACALSALIVVGYSCIFLDLMMWFGFTFNNSKGATTTNYSEILKALDGVSLIASSVIAGTVFFAQVAKMYRWWMKLMADSNDGVSDS